MISILIPVRDEAAILERSVLTVHRYLMRRELNHEIIIVSNGSTDATPEIGRKLAASYQFVTYIELAKPSVGGAFRAGVEQAKFEKIVSLDADLSCGVLFLEDAVWLLERGDMVVGSKSMGFQRRSWLRVSASQTYLFFAQVLLGLTISDYSIGVKGYRRSAILPALPHLDSWTGYVLELALYLTRSGRKVVQVGVDCHDTRKSRFHLCHEGIYRFAHLFRCFWRLRNPGSWLNTTKAPTKIEVDLNVTLSDYFP